MGFLAAALVCTALIPGCPRAAVPGAEAPSGQPAPPVRAFQLEYRRSGGLAPSSSALTVRPGRHAVASVDAPRVGRRTVRFRIGVARVRSLRRGLAAAGFERLQSPPPGHCADCYAYAIRYRGHRVRFDDSTMPAALRPVVNRLEATIAAHAIPPNA